MSMARCVAPAYPKELKEKVRSLYLTNLPHKEISAKTGIGVGTIAAWATRHGWNKERTAIERRLVEKVESKMNKAIETLKVNEHQDRIHAVTKAKLDILAKFEPKKSSDLVYQANALKTLDDVARRNLGLSNEEKQPSQFSLHLGSMPEPKEVVEVRASVVEAKTNESDPNST